MKHGTGKLVANAIAEVISRADELAEFVTLYWKLNPKRANGKNATLSAQMKKGLAKAFPKFNEYALAKYNRDTDVKLRDVLFLCHAKAIYDINESYELVDESRDALWKRLINGELTTPDTWEVELSAGKDKKATFERLITENKLGYFALLRNLRNMVNAGCDLDIVRSAIIARKGGAEKVLSFRYIAAARAAPQLESYIDQAQIIKRLEAI